MAQPMTKEKLRLRAIARKRLADQQGAGAAAESQADKTLSSPLVKSAQGFSSTYGTAKPDPRITPEIRDLPEIASTNPDFKTGMKIVGAVMTIPDDDERMRALKTMIPELEYEKDEHGTYVITMPNGEKSVLNRPGMSRSDLLNFGSQAAMYATPARAIGLGKGLLQKIGLGALIGGGVETNMQLAQEAQGGEFDWQDIAFASALGGAGEVVAGALKGAGGVIKNQGLKKIGSESQLPKRTLENVRKAEEAGGAMDVRMAKFQKTENPVQVMDAEIAGGSVGGGSTMRDFYIDQNEDIITALNRKIKDAAGPGEGLSEAGTDLRQFAKDYIETAKAKRQIQADKFYGEAEKFATTIESGELRGIADNIGESFGNPNLPVVRRIRELMPSFGADGAEPTLTQLHSARKRIDDIVDMEVDGKPDIDTANALKRLRAEINNRIDAAAKNGDKGAELFRKGDREFARLSPEVDAAKNSIFGKLARRSDTTKELGVQDMFSTGGLSTAELVQAKNQIQQKSPDLWRRIYRAELEEMLKKGPNSKKGAEYQRLPYKLEQLLFNQGRKSERLLALAPDAEVRKNLNFFQEVLRKAQIGRDVNSKTAFREPRIEEHKRKNITRLMRLRQTVIRAIDDMGFNETMRKLSETLTDADWKPAMEAVKKYGMESKQADDAISDFLKSRLRANAQAARSVSGDDSQEETPASGVPGKTLNVK